MPICEICKKEIKRGQKFILSGVYPSFGKGVTYRLTHGCAGQHVADYGTMYHEKCYKKALK